MTVFGARVDRTIARTCWVAEGTCPRCGSTTATDGDRRWCIDPERVCSWGLGEHDRGSRDADVLAAHMEAL